jgi:hypothetical protein
MSAATDAIESRRELITPEIAARILATVNVGNRPIAQHIVRSYAAEMSSGNWMESHQGPAFDEDGNLLDGQHRLAAIVESGHSVFMNVTYNVPRASFDVLDIGYKRTAAHVITGANATVQAAACRYLTDPPRLVYVGRLLNRQAVEIAASHPRLEEAAALGQHCYKATRIAAGMHAAMLVLAWDQGASDELVADWINGLVLGESLTADDPRLLLRNRWMTQSKYLNSGASRSQSSFLLARAWNAYATGTRMAKLQLPRLDGPTPNRALEIQGRAA